MQRPLPAYVRPRLASAGPVVACLLALACTGCSLRLLRPAPPRSEWPDPVLPSSSEEPCTESAVPVAADAVFGTIFGGLGYVERNSGSPEIAFAIGTLAVPVLVSAIYGAVTVSRCHTYKARFHDAAANGQP
jgi:hypothetical protein